MRKFLFVLIMSMIAVVSAQSIQGTVLDITTAEGADKFQPSLTKRVIKNDPSSAVVLKVDDIVNERDFLITGINTNATIKVDDVEVKIHPLSVVQLWSAYEKEKQLQEIWNLESGDIGVDFNTKRKNSKVAFNTATGYSVLITGTSFDLNSSGLVKLHSGSVSFYGRGFFRDSNSFTRSEKTRPIGKLKPGEIGDGRQKPMPDPEFAKEMPKGNPVVFTPIENKPEDDKKEPLPEKNNPMALPPDNKRRSQPDRGPSPNRGPAPNNGGRGPGGPAGNGPAK